MKKPKIAFDIDDVTADSTESLRLLVNRRHGVELTKEHYRVPYAHGSYYEYVWESNGLGHLDYAAFESEMVTDQSHVTLMPGFKEALGRLQERYDIVFITARDISWEAATRVWFNRQLGDDVELYFSEGYTNKGRKSKGEICKELGVEWLVDDVLDHCLGAIKAGVRTILFGEYGWHGDIPDTVIRCRDWSEVEKVLLHA